MLQALYQELILKHYRNPRNRGELEDGNAEIRMNNPTCGDEITLRLRLKDGQIQAVRFMGEGCAISQASASMMAALVEGHTVEESQAVADRFREMLRGDGAAAADRALGDLRALAGVARYPARVRCAMLAWNALEEVVKAAAAEAAGAAEPE